MTSPYDQDPTGWTPPVIGQLAASAPPPYPQQTPSYPVPMSGPPTSPPPYYPQTAPMPPYPQQPQIIVLPQQQQTPTSTLATLSLVFSILGFVSACCAFGIPSAAAVILGHFALNETKDGKKSGHGMAIAGLVVGYIIVIPAVVLSIMVVFGGAMESFNPTPSPTP